MSEARFDVPLTARWMLHAVDVHLSIGEFSKMTYLSVKALRHYHDIGLLEPVAVDPVTGYRLYDAGQVATAQAIRRFRELDMPIDRIRAVLDAPDPVSRNRALLTHLEHMKLQLERTQATVASLHALLEDSFQPGVVEQRSIPATLVLAISEDVACADSGPWCAAVFPELHDALRAAGRAPAGPDGALYSDEFFEAGKGPVTAFIPLAEPMKATGRTALLDLAPVEVAMLVHVGPFEELDQTYGVLGTYVAGRGLSAGGPIREHYLVGGDDVDPAEHRTEVGWPITSTAG